MKKIQFLRNYTVYTPSNSGTALQTAKNAIMSLADISDGEIVLARYQESSNEDIKTLLCIYYDGSTETGWTFIGGLRDEIEETEETIAQALSDLDERVTENASTIDSMSGLSSRIALAESDITEIGETIEENEEITAGALADIDSRLTELEEQSPIEYTETDPVFEASPAHGITSNDITNWNGKTSNVGTVTGVKMNNGAPATPDSNGVVDLGTVITSHQSLASYADGAEYDSQNKLIYLKHGNTRLSNPIDATDFIKDGMVNSVTVGNGTGPNVGVPCLIISFNTDAGKEDIELPLTQIFNPNNYYTKTEIDNAGYETTQKRFISFSISANNAISFTDENGETMTHAEVNSLVSDSNNDVEFEDEDGNIFRVTYQYSGGFGVDQTINYGLVEDGVKYDHYGFGYSNGAYTLLENFSTQFLTSGTTKEKLLSSFPFVCARAYEQVTLTEPSYTIAPYKVYNLGTLNNRTVTISFDTTKEVSGYTAEYTVRFTSGTGSYGVTLPNTVLWANGTAPTYVAGRTYEINVVNNLAVFGEFY